MTHRVPKNGIIIKVVPPEDTRFESTCIVQPQDGGRQIWANPSDLRLIK
jgi:hypothetical protein